MTKQEFLIELRKTKKHFLWKIRENKLRGTLRGDSKLRLIASLKTFCPMTAVCLSKTKKEISMMNFWAAGDLLDVDVKTTNLIVHAADVVKGYELERKEILQACGVTQ